MRDRITPGAVYVGAVLAFVFAPLVFVVVFAFNESTSAAFPLGGATLAWFGDFLHDPRYVNAAKHSLYVALAVAACAGVIGTTTSLAIVKCQSRTVKVVITTLIVLPVLLPPLLIGIALLVFFSDVGVPLSLGTVVVGHVLLTLPFIVLPVTTRLATIDASLEEAARTLGATQWQTFWRITLPLLRPALLGGMMIVAALSLDEFIVAFFTIGTSNTLPTVIWGEMREGVSPVVNAVSTLMLTVTMLLVVGVWLLGRKRWR